MRIAKYVLFYHPSVDDLSRWKALNIHGFWNSPNKADYFGENIGISGAICHMKNYSKDNGFDGFIFFDQDTLISEETIRDMNDYIVLQGNENILHFSGLYNSSEKIRFFINSCTYFPVSFLDAINEKELRDYFVDGVDLFLSIKAKELGVNKKRLYLESIDHVSNQDWLDIRGIQIKAYSTDRLTEIEKSHIKVLRYAVGKLFFLEALVICKFIVSIKLDTWRRRFL